ncbi:MAG: hypothetical protein AAF085_16600, partial [Planctomycetota bacterium]
MKTTAALSLCLFAATSILAEHPVPFETQVLAKDANEGVEVADYDKDGWLDVSAGRFLYLNPGKKDGDWIARPLRVL